jgi:hypothetical protein
MQCRAAKSTGEEYLRRLPNHIKDADPDILVLEQAKAEYAKLQ